MGIFLYIYVYCNLKQNELLYSGDCWWVYIYMSYLNIVQMLIFTTFVQASIAWVCRLNKTLRETKAYTCDYLGTPYSKYSLCKIIVQGWGATRSRWRRNDWDLYQCTFSKCECVSTGLRMVAYFPVFCGDNLGEYGLKYQWNEYINNIAKTYDSAVRNHGSQHPAGLPSEPAVNIAKSVRS